MWVELIFAVRKVVVKVMQVRTCTMVVMAQSASLGTGP